MAISVDGTSSWTDGNTIEDPYTSGSLTPPNGAKIYVLASAYAGSGDDASKMVVTGTVLTWAQVSGAFLDQFTNGGSIAPPPIGFWVATSTGVAITVTQECVDGIGFSHVQGIWVLPGAGSVIDTGTFTGLGAASISLDATASGQIALFGMIDWGNSSNVPVKSNASMTTRKSGASGDVQSHLLADLFSTGSGSLTVGTNVLASPAGTNAVAILVEAAAGEVFGSASLSAETSLSVAGTATSQGSAGLSAQTSLTAAGQATSQASAALSAQTALAASASVEALGSAAMTAQSGLLADAFISGTGSAALTAQSSLTATGQPGATGAVALSGESALSATAVVTATAAVSLTATGVLTAAADGTDDLIYRPDDGLTYRPDLGLILRP